MVEIKGTVLGTDSRGLWHLVRYLRPSLELGELLGGVPLHLEDCGPPGPQDVLGEANDFL